jgi:hypothetical protein
MSEEMTQQHQALQAIQDMILELPAERQQQVYMYAEDIRDILTEGAGDAFLALTLISCEFAATSAELDKEEKDNGTIIAG